MTTKPTRFSDPYHDWDGCGDRLDEILSKPAIDLVVDDYSVIFARHLPAADYQEGLYYLPYCLDYISSGREVRSSRYPDSLLWWIHNYREELKADGHWDSVLQGIKAAGLALLTDFELFDLTEEECAEIGRDYGYSIGPYNQHTVHDFVDDLTIWPEYAGIVDKLLAGVRNFESISSARWYVELAFHSRTWCLLFDPHTDLDDFENKERIFHDLHAFRYLQKAQEIAGAKTYEEGRAKYNRLVLI